MSSQMGKDGTFQPPQAKQAQSKPGLEKEMAPSSESTKLEGSEGFVEYTGSNKLKDKKVLITGGDSGIGRSVAALMAREGADITIVYLPEEQEDAEHTKQLVEKEGRSCLLVPGDLRKNETCKKAVEEHVNKFKHINVLVNNASKQYMCKDLAEIDLDKVEDTFRTNILQMIAITKYALPHMSKGDSIINNTSVTTFRGSGTMVDYASTKGAIVGFTRSLALQLMPKGIRVNAVAPGSVYTPIQIDTRDAESMEGWASGKPLGRPGQPSEVATSFVFLASKDASFYSGQVLHCYPLGE
ncbi:oxidoreductase [Aspergillus japonicus CBS 114.51]|uniref:Oxidoreductase n=1 Tax=Aspergillus japonicus CBS 114.51 TaxID=1448312 RepID=A0A8T8X323_ASPJA|nr:oxidoreductase [Aspergillus japonicus CBS 114.51]RAH82445.1 oxidoreductase [Aspergillus japonicus CBS 114.51]